MVFSRYAFNFDDGFFWLSILRGSAIFNGLGVAGGRFFPAASLELNLLMQISPSPYLFFGFNALLSLALGVLLWRFCRVIAPNCGVFRLAVALFCFLNVGFVVAILGICYSDRILCLAFLAWVVATFGLFRAAQKPQDSRGLTDSLDLADSQDSPNSPSPKDSQTSQDSPDSRHPTASRPRKFRLIFLAFFAILFANYAIYLKEPAFLVIGGFGAVNLLCFWREIRGEIRSRFRQKIQPEIRPKIRPDFSQIRAPKSPQDSQQDSLPDSPQTPLSPALKLYLFYCAFLCLSAAIFLGIYVGFVLPNAASLYGAPKSATALGAFLNVFANLRGFFLAHPFLALLLPALVAFRTREIWRGGRFCPFFDALLLCCLAYFLAYLKLGLMRPYYFAPLYFLLAPCVVFYRERLRRGVLRGIFALCLAFFALQALPQSVFKFAFLKSQGVANAQTMEFLRDFAGDLQREIRVFFDGLGRNVSVEEEYFLWHFGLFLREVYGLNADILTNAPNAPDPLSWRYEEDSPLSILNSSEISAPKSGDFVIVNRNSYKPIDAAYLARLGEKYELIFRTDVFGLPNLTLKSVAKWALSRTLNLGANLAANPNATNLGDANPSTANPNAKNLGDEAANLAGVNPSVANPQRDQNYFRAPVDNYVFRVR